VKILIAEDDRVSRRILETTLTGWGYQTIVTEDGNAAWNVLKGADAPELAILDVMMPEIDGFELCRRVRESNGWIPPYIILLTGRSTKEDVVHGIKAGANDYLSKPFYREELKVRVEVGIQMLELHKSLSERVKELEVALTEVKQLRGLVPICSYCKNVRNDENFWQQVETYISSRTSAVFSHSICPECFEQIVRPELAKLRGEMDQVTESEFSHG
jgi:sigma-B regulation protein RsbU (phosphoserine phosphatase)